MKNILKNTLICSVIILFTCKSAFAMDVKYTSMAVPNIDSAFKTYMDYRAVTNKASAQYRLLREWAWSDGAGFMRINGERDSGITDDYYCIALGSYYGTTMGTKYRITTDTGNVFYGILSDGKADCDTNSTHQYAVYNRDIIEYLVYTPKLISDVKIFGSANVYSPLNGRITKIERIDFN